MALGSGWGLSFASAPPLAPWGTGRTLLWVPEQPWLCQIIEGSDVYQEPGSEQLRWVPAAWPGGCEVCSWAQTG